MSEDYKAKYEEALERAKRWADGTLQPDRTTPQGVCETIFPELAESEDEDERIREWLVDYFSSIKSGVWIHRNTITCEQILAYLEKQKTSEEALRYVKENHSPDEVSDFQAAMNIAVAKAYDRGVQDTLEKQKEQKPIPLMNGDANLYFNNWYHQEIIGSPDRVPTAQQCFEEGLRYSDMVHLELKQQEQKPCLTCDEYDKGYKQGYTEGCTAGYNKAILEQPKQEWSKEDERRFISCMGRLQTADGAPTINSNWFEEHCYKHPSWKPSEEQMNSLNYGIYVLEEEGYDASASEIKELYEQLKKLMEE